ncbi:MAG: sigma-54-dependent Fis family transcriptional regulator [Acidobacteriaceae bacterium]|nr:sigma-54-dependent Fis family transcriptional regulator [Acidobacteriaceae bacterium]MBV9497915.1 sigma-54-dependent Fis family transcriptional regulator [Acidobacteriaceae bacterium]
MTTAKKTVLIGEDDSEVRGYLEMAVKCMGYDVMLAQDGDEVLSLLQEDNKYHVVLLDIIMPRKDGIEALRDIRKMSNSLPVIMVSDASSTMNVVQAMKIGATDFLSKPAAYEELRNALQKAMDSVPEAPAANGVSENGSASGKLFFGTNQRMHAIRRILRDVAPSEAPVLIRGETGAGKEVIARELHALSLRSKKSFLKLNCAALPSELVESELFGYERGAFTGAFQKKPGMFELADGGTILLDEIGDMDFKLQAKLLQVLQDHEFQRIGGKETVRVDVRVIAATHRDLEQAIANRQFREDLYYRLNVISIELPALRERKGDIIPMAEFLIRKNCPSSPPSLTSAMKQALVEYSWPGNIRELENVVRRFIILRDGDGIARDLRTKIERKDPARPETAVPDHAPDSAPTLAQVTKAKQEAESAAILGALSTTRWNRKQAAALLKIDYKALLYKMKKLGIDDGGASMSTEAPKPNEHTLAILGD